MEWKNPLTKPLAEFAVGLQWSDLPESVVHEGKRAFLNTLGVGIAGMQDAELFPLFAYVRDQGGAAQVPLWVGGERVSAQHSCLIHGMACHVLDFDDTHLQAMIHPSPPLLPVPFAMCAGQSLQGREVLLAFILGIELQFRIGEAVRLAGFHPTAVLGNLGAVATGGRLLGLDAGTLCHALGLAVTQAAGVSGMNGTHAKSFHVGKAAMNGFMAARLAAGGMTAKSNSLEAQFMAACASAARGKDPLEGLGSSFRIGSNSYKPFACGVVAHPAIDAIIRIRKEHNPEPSEVDSIVCDVTRSVVRATGIPVPRDALQARFSTAHSVAVALLDGKAGLLQYSESRLEDPVLRDLTGRVGLKVDESLGLHEARLRVRMKNGEEFAQNVSDPKGSILNPLCDSELEEKFKDCVEPVLGKRCAQAVMESVWNMDEMADFEKLAQWLVTEQK